MTNYIFEEEPYITWLVYSWRGNIMVKQGHMRKHHSDYQDNINVFEPIEGVYPWHTNCPSRPMEVAKGKVWVWFERDIPEAKDMIIEYHKSRSDSVNKNYDAAIQNIKRVTGMDYDIRAWERANKVIDLQKQLIDSLTNQVNILEDKVGCLEKIVEIRDKQVKLLEGEVFKHE